MSTATATAIEATALLVGPGAGSESQLLGELMHDLGFDPVFAKPNDLRALQGVVALCIVDLRGNGDALRAIRVLRAQYPSTVIVGLADLERPSAAADAIRAGAFDVLPRPPARRDLEMILANAGEQAVLARAQSGQPSDAALPYGLISVSASMSQVREIVQRAAGGRCGILICGERGTGRETIARAIHAHGPNRHAPFVRLDCADSASPEHELFGTMAPSTSSADRRDLERIVVGCRLHDAADGVLFLEHVTDLPSRAQARLMRVLRDREVVIGDSETSVPLDVRAIASAEATIEMAVEDGRVRADLFERLSLIRIDVPPLRMRREDIGGLASHLLKELCREHARPIKTLTRSALTLLGALPWRGNATELRGLLERLMLLVPSGLIRLEDVLAHTQLDGSVGPTGADATLHQARNRFERDYIAAVLQHHHGRVAEAARVLGIQRTNLYRKMRRLNLMQGRVQKREA